MLKEYVTSGFVCVIQEERKKGRMADRGTLAWRYLASVDASLVYIQSAPD